MVIKVKLTSDNAISVFDYRNCFEATKKRAQFNRLYYLSNSKQQSELASVKEILKKMTKAILVAKENEVDSFICSCMDGLLEDIEEFEEYLKNFKFLPKEPIVKPNSIGATVTSKCAIFSDEMNFQSGENLLKTVEFELYKRVLHECRGSRTEASKKLGVSIRTVRNKLKEFNLQ